jgi:hypothetical protein
MRDFTEGPRLAAALLLALVFVLAGCGPEVDLDPDLEGDAMPLYFERIGRGQSASIRDSIQVVIRDAAEWEGYRTQLRPMRPFMEVDFDQVMVLLIAMPMETGGYDVAFESVEEADGRIVASYVLSEPGADCMTGVGITVPFEAIMVRRVEGDVVFEPRRDRIRCTVRRGPFS